MPQDFGFKVVTIDEGDGPVKAVKDAGGRIVTAEQVDTIRQKQEADMAQISDLRDKLVAGDPTAKAQIVGQVKDSLTRQLAMLDKQKTDTAATLAKLEAGDVAATADVVDRMTKQLGRRVDLVIAARDRSVQMLSEVAPGGVDGNTKSKPVTPVTPATPAITPAG